MAAAFSALLVLPAGHKDWTVPRSCRVILLSRTTMSLEQSITEYNEKRRELIADDRSLRLDSQRKYSATELEADRIVRSIRAQEAETVWSADYPDIPHPFPGMEFLTGLYI